MARSISLAITDITDKEANVGIVESQRRSHVMLLEFIPAEYDELTGLELVQHSARKLLLNSQALPVTKTVCLLQSKTSGHKFVIPTSNHSAQQ